MKVKGSPITRHDVGVKAILSIPLIAALGVLNAYAFADEAADRVAISKVIASLNNSASGASRSSSPQAALFVADGRGYSEFQRLKSAHPQGFRIQAPSVDLARPRVTISHEPWGEAEINMPGRDPDIVFITPDVAVADAACTYQDAGATETLPLSFVLKKVGEEWKIASLRVLALRPAQMPR